MLYGCCSAWHDEGLYRAVQFYTAPIHSWGNDAHRRSLDPEDYARMELSWFVRRLGFSVPLVPKVQHVAALRCSRRGPWSMRMARSSTEPRSPMCRATARETDLPLVMSRAASEARRATSLVASTIKFRAALSAAAAAECFLAVGAHVRRNRSRDECPAQAPSAIWRNGCFWRRLSVAPLRRLIRPRLRRRWRELVRETACGSRATVFI